MSNSTANKADDKAGREAEKKARRRAEQAQIVAGLRGVLESDEQLLAFTRGRIAGGWRGKLNIGPEAFFAPFVNVGLTERRVILQHIHPENGRPSEILPHFFALADISALSYTDIETFSAEPACRLVLRLGNDQHFRLRLNGADNCEQAKTLGEVFRSLMATRQRTPSPTQRLCSRCDHILDQSFKFCPYCGGRLSEPERSEPESAAPPVDQAPLSAFFPGAPEPPAPPIGEEPPIPSAAMEPPAAAAPPIAPAPPMAPDPPVSLAVVEPPAAAAPPIAPDPPVDFASPPATEPPVSPVKEEPPAAPPTASGTETATAGLAEPPEAPVPAIEPATPKPLMPSTLLLTPETAPPLPTAPLAPVPPEPEASGTWEACAAVIVPPGWPVPHAPFASSPEPENAQISAPAEPPAETSADQIAFAPRVEVPAAASHPDTKTSTAASHPDAETSADASHPRTEDSAAGWRPDAGEAADASHSSQGDS